MLFSKQKIKQENKFKEEKEKFDIASRHFHNRTLSEKSYFDGKVAIDGIPSKYVETGESNSTETFEWVKEKQPEYLLLFGSSIIKDPLLSYFGDNVINMHLGLSPYYRGAGTNFWPLVNEEPECVGATIHLATLKVDAGAILLQVRPKIDPNDGPHDLGNKTIIAAIKQIPKIVVEHKKGQRIPQKQDLSIGKVYKRRDLTSQSIEMLYQNFDKGMIGAFLRQAPKRLSKYPIIE